jgi:hypothetical protein
MMAGAILSRENDRHSACLSVCGMNFRSERGELNPMSSAISVALLCLSAAIYNSCSRRSVERTVTLDAAHRPALPREAPTVSALPLPTTNRRIELIGDRVAEARLRLKNAQRAAAARALQHAQTELKALLSDPLPAGFDEHVLREMLAEIEKAQLAVERGLLDAARQSLLKIDQKLNLSHN